MVIKATYSKVMIFDILFFLLTSIISISCNQYTDFHNYSSEKINLQNNWEITYCESENCINPIKHICNIPVIFTPELISYFNSFRGYIKLTKIFAIHENTNFDLFLLSLGKIGDADKTYFNGEFIGKTGEFPPIEFSEWNTKRYYLIKSNKIKKKDLNILEITIACYGFNRMIGEIYLQPITIKEYNRLLLIENLKKYFPLFCNIGSGITFFIILFMLCYNKENRGKYVFFLLQLIPGLIVIAEPTLTFPLYKDTFLRIKIFGIAWSFLVLFHLLFLHRLYLYKRYKTECLLFLLTIIILFKILCATDISTIKTTGIGTIIILTSLALYNLSLHVEQILKRNITAFLFVPIGITLAITAAHDGFVFLSIFQFKIFQFCGYQFDTPIFQYTSNAIFIGAGLIIVHQYILMSKTIENINILLEQKVNERTKQLQTSLENLSKAIELGFFTYPRNNSHEYSPQLEPKIKKAIIFINNNYKENISREGLASMLDLHPDYFSKAFRFFTGKKINDYINELRIKEALKLLNNTNMNILDIAMFVGFENLKTFNRAFKKFTGKNPSYYRKK